MRVSRLARRVGSHVSNAALIPPSFKGMVEVRVVYANPYADHGRLTAVCEKRTDDEQWKEYARFTTAGPVLRERPDKPYPHFTMWATDESFDEQRKVHSKPLLAGRNLRVRVEAEKEEEYEIQIVSVDVQPKARSGIIHHSAAFEQIIGGQTGNTTSVTVVFDDPTVSGNLIDLSLSAWGGGFDFDSATDSQSNSYEVIDALTANTIHAALYAKAITGGSSHGVTVAFSGNRFFTLYAMELSGCDLADPLQDFEHAGFSAGSGGADLTVPDITPDANGMFVSSAGYDNGGSWTEESGWDLRGQIDFGYGSTGPNAVATKNGTSGAADGITWTSSGNATRGAITRFYREAAGGGPTPKPTPYYMLMLAGC